MALGFEREGGRERGEGERRERERREREREASERREVTSPSPSTRPYTGLYWGLPIGVGLGEVGTGDGLEGLRPRVHKKPPPRKTLH